MEIEIKAKVEDLARVRDKVLAAGAKKVGDKHQLDVYLSPPHKTFFKTRYYLRVRQDLFGNGDSFDYKILEKGLGDSSVAKEKEVRVEDGKVLLSILKDLDFTENCRIEKKREVFELDDFEVVLDKVKDLGDFIEVEMEGRSEDEPKYREIIIAFLERLGVKENQFCKDVGYVELMTNTSARDWEK